MVVFRQDAFLPDLVSAHPNQKPYLSNATSTDASCSRSAYTLRQREPAERIRIMGGRVCKADLARAHDTTAAGDAELFPSSTR